MLRKLMKHEFRATARVMVPLYLILLATAVGGNFSIRLMDYSSNEFLNILGMLLMMAFVVAVIGVCVMSFVLMVQRFHKNLMGDEGYVMFTLPASIHQHIWSKMLVASVWFILTGVVVVLSLIIMVYEVGFMTELIRDLGKLMEHMTAYYALNGTAIALEFLLLVFVGCIGGCLEVYAAMATGHSFANHKIALSVLFFFGFQFALQAISSFLMVGLEHLNIWNWDFDLEGMAAVHLLMVVMIVLTVLCSAVYYVITSVMLKKRLNLE